MASVFSSSPKMLVRSRNSAGTGFKFTVELGIIRKLFRILTRFNTDPTSRSLRRNGGTNGETIAQVIERKRS